jgi:hypothetical protein
MHNQVIQLICSYYVKHNSLKPFHMKDIKLANRDATRKSIHYSKIYEKLYYDILKDKKIFNENIILEKNGHILLKDENGHMVDISHILKMLGIKFHIMFFIKITVIYSVN